MDIKQLQYFVVSVDMGSFSSAAEILITTQPNVSKTVKSLEEELRMTLLNRDRSGVTLTKQGEIIYNYAIEVLKNVKMITDFTSESQMDKLSICSIPSNAISSILSKFYNEKSKDKEFRIDYIECKIEDMITSIHKRESELGFIYISKKNMSAFNSFINSKGIKFYEIKKLPLYLYVGRENPLYGKKYINEHDIGNTKLMQYYEDQYSLYNYLEHLKKEIFFNKGQSNICYTNSNHFLIQSLKNTKYGSISSSFIENEYIEKNISSIPILSSENSVSFGYIKRSKGKLSTIAEEFISYLKEQIRLNGYKE
ncbi:LysR family transcriptional regulator [Terrisporobacter sp.]